MKIGVDGGGTKTEFILTDRGGSVVARHIATGCNPSVVGPTRAREILTTALLAATENCQTEISSTLLCMAGSPDFWREFAAKLTGFGKVDSVTDAVPVLELATTDKPGLVMHAGTGSFVALHAPDDTIRYAGGLGWRIGDPGSAQDIGRRGVARGLAELQGWAEKSALSPALAEVFGADTPSIITAALHQNPEPNQLIGSFAAKVSQFAAAGDTAAREVVLTSCTELLACAELAALRVFPSAGLRTLPSGLSGPILIQPFVVEALRVRTQLKLTPVTEPAIEGVRRLLLKRA